jgi:serine/threonine protein kinase
MREDKDELYMMMELADTDLHRLIQSSCPLTEGHIRVIMFQILSGVKAMHDNGVLHRDLKPGNLLLNKDCELKITDFGLARMIPRDLQASGQPHASADATSPSVVSPMTEYVVTRWYRPPELMLAPNGCYDGAVDMWSVGCILGELVSRKPLFPGTDFMDQLTRVFKVVAIPNEETRGYAVEKDALKFLQSLPPTPENAVEKHFKNAPPLALDLLKKLLCFNPRERLSADEALAHAFFDGVKEEWGDIAELKLGHSLEFAFEQQSLPLATLRQYICDEVRAFRERDATKRDASKSVDTAAATEASVNGSGTNQQASGDAAKAAQLRLANDMAAGRGFTLKGCDFNVPPQYKPLQVLGEGSYGIVW